MNKEYTRIVLVNGAILPRCTVTYDGTRFIHVLCYDYLEGKEFITKMSLVINNILYLERPYHSSTKTPLRNNKGG